MKMKDENYSRRILIAGIFFWFSNILFLTQVAEIKNENILFEDKYLNSRLINEGRRSKVIGLVEEPKHKISLIIDDIGSEMGSLYELSKLNLPLTISVLPYRRYSKEAAYFAKSKGWEVMLHLPMEPVGYPAKDPGEAALFVNMNKKEIEERLLEIFDSVPYIKGFNNHMGSKFTKIREKMEIVMEEAKNHNLYFIDSKTTNKSVGYKVAIENGIPALERTIFLDSLIDKEFIKKNLMELIKISKAKGYAIGICHTHPETMEVLKELPSIIRRERVNAVLISALIYGANGFSRIAKR